MQANDLYNVPRQYTQDGRPHDNQRDEEKFPCPAVSPDPGHARDLFVSRDPSLHSAESAVAADFAENREHQDSADQNRETERTGEVEGVEGFHCDAHELDGVQKQAERGENNHAECESLWSQLATGVRADKSYIALSQRHWENQNPVRSDEVDQNRANGWVFDGFLLWSPSRVENLADANVGERESSGGQVTADESGVDPVGRFVECGCLVLHHDPQQHAVKNHRTDRKEENQAAIGQ